MPDSNRKISTEVLRALFERATVSAWIIDADETIVLANDAAAELTGYAAEELIGQPMSMLMAPELGLSMPNTSACFSPAGAVRASSVRCANSRSCARTVSFVPIELKAFALPESPAGKPLFGAFISDNTAHKNIENEMKRTARQDYLTGSLNRLGFMERARQEISRAGRSGRPLSLIVMDIDRFKRINDLHGHLGGDKVLAELLSALAGSLRAHDVFGRVGGEEFFILLPETDIAEAASVAERLRKALQQHAFICNGKTVPVTASLGCASLRADDDLDRLIQRADRRMYLAKNAGRNRVVAVDVASSGQNSETPAERLSCTG